MADHESVLWGFHSVHAPWPIKLTGGVARTLWREQRQRESNGWTCAIYPARRAPLGLRIQASRGELAPIIRTVEDIRRRDCDFLTVDTVQVYTGCTKAHARGALVAVMGEDWMSEQEAYLAKH